VTDSVVARTWMSRDGKQTIEAELLDFRDGRILLRRDDGKVFDVPLEKFSLADVKYVHDALQAAGRTTSGESPFDAPREQPPTPQPAVVDDGV